MCYVCDNNDGGDMNKFNSVYIRGLLILILTMILIAWLVYAGPNAFASGMNGVIMFVVVSLALLLTIINSVYRVITFKETQNEI